MAGTGHTAFSTLPVIAEVAKGQGVRVLSSSTVYRCCCVSNCDHSFANLSSGCSLQQCVFAPFGVDYLTLLMVCIPTTFITACMVGAIVANYMGEELKDDPVYQERL
ncbi:hypothetical protein OH492_02410 [Vibrio chagasii]|nr:hypothetical protein [Vibrio chagasii]